LEIAIFIDFEEIWQKQIGGKFAATRTYIEIFI